MVGFLVFMMESVAFPVLRALVQHLAFELQGANVTIAIKPP